MTKRYFVETPITTETASIDGIEARHLTKVMRLKMGDQVTLFDGSGFEFLATVNRLERANVQLSIESKVHVDRELPVRLTLAVALPKGDRQKWLVEKAVELGVTRLIPLRTERGVAQPLEKTLQRLGRTVIEASKQCGRNRLMRIEPAHSVDQLVDEYSGKCAGLLADPGPGSMPVSDIRTNARSVCIAIGPEGGFTEKEIRTASSWQSVQLGARILRVETAAIALAAFVALNPAFATMK